MLPSSCAGTLHATHAMPGHAGQTVVVLPLLLPSTAPGCTPPSDRAQAAYTSAWQSSWSQLDERSLHVADTGVCMSTLAWAPWYLSSEQCSMALCACLPSWMVRSVHAANCVPRSAGEVWSMAEGVRWRILNSTLRCTRNEAQPPARVNSSHGAIYEAQLALSMLASVVALLAGLHWLTNRDGEAEG